jgi:hypothetical protein
MAAERLEDGSYVHSLGEVAKFFDVCRPRVTQLCRVAGLPHRPPGGPRKSTRPKRGGPKWLCPQSLRYMLSILSKKVGANEARRLVREHAELRGIT